MKFKTKLTISFWVVGIIPIFLTGMFAMRKADEALTISAFSHLRSVRESKRVQIKDYFTERKVDMNILAETVATIYAEQLAKLTAVSGFKKASIQSYFDLISNQVITFSESRMIVDAMKDFQIHYKNVVKENLYSRKKIQSLRKDLQAFYKKGFLLEYKKRNKANENQLSLDLKLNSNSVALQYHYIASNPNPVGTKYRLMAATDKSLYSKLHREVHPVIQSYLEKFGYYDVFLVEPEAGIIVYSASKEIDFGTSLLSGPLAKTNIGDVFRKANKAKQGELLFLSDYERYYPSYDAPAAFLASPVFDGFKKIGVVIFQMPIKRLNNIVSDRSGLGKTGESYLVGGDYLMRSDSFNDSSGRSVVSSFKSPEKGEVRTESVERALAKMTGHRIIYNYQDNLVLSAFTPVTFGEITWALIVEMNVAEAFSPKHIAGHSYFDSYRDKYGYLDFYLINSDGFTFFSSGRDDYQTNLLTGKYSKTRLGNLFSEVIVSQRFGFADYSMYMPNDEEPVSFMAQPIIHNDEVVFVVALKGAHKGLNEIMSSREGMSQTGEVYLVGSDKLLRSDTFLDPINHSFKSGVSGDVSLNGIDTVASREALSGKTGQAVAVNYLGDSVLSSYTPVKFEGNIWAVVAEVSVNEAFEPVYSIKWGMILIGAICAVLVFAVSLFLTRTIAAPLKQGVLFADSIRKGDLSKRIKYANQNDEIAKLNGSLNAMAEELEKKVTLVKEIAQGDLTREVALSSDKDMLGLAMNVMVKRLSDNQSDISRREWITQGIISLNEKIRKQKEPERLCDTIVSFVARYVDAQVGVIYTIQKNGNFKVSGCYAVSGELSRGQELKPGVGLIWQAVKEERDLVLDNIPEGYLTVSSGFVETSPKYIIVKPLVYNNRVNSVMELGTLSPLTETQMDFISQCRENMALTINASESHLS